MKEIKKKQHFCPYIQSYYPNYETYYLCNCPFGYFLCYLAITTTNTYLSFFLSFLTNGLSSCLK